MSTKRLDMKKKQKRTFMVIAVVTLFIVILSVLLYRNQQKTLHSHHKKIRPIETVSNTNNLVRQNWMVKAQGQIERHAQKIDKIQQQVNSMRKDIQKENQQLAKNAKSRSSVKNSYSHHPTVGYPPPPANLPRNPVNVPNNSINTRNKRATYISNPNSNNKSQPPLTQRQQTNLIGIVSVTEQTKTNDKETAKQTTYLPNKQNKQNKQKYTIPPGSFASAFLLTGADVPTMGNGSVGPIPVVFRVMSLAQMPNKWKADIKSCFLLGEATGSLASERAYIRINQLSCMTKSGKPLVKRVQGYATGIDGKVGLNGRIVSKQGSMLARTLIAGFLQGVGQAFSQSQTNISISPLGQTSSVTPDTKTLARYGVGGGVSKSTELLAKFYMKMANQMFPVIEINAGRKADIIFLQGVKL